MTHRTSRSRRAVVAPCCAASPSAVKLPSLRRPARSATVRTAGLRGRGRGCSSPTPLARSTRAAVRAGASSGLASSTCRPAERRLGPPRRSAAARHRPARPAGCRSPPEVRARTPSRPTSPGGSRSRSSCGSPAASRPDRSAARRTPARDSWSSPSRRRGRSSTASSSSGSVDGPHQQRQAAPSGVRPQRQPGDELVRHDEVGAAQPDPRRGNADSIRTSRRRQAAVRATARSTTGRPAGRARVAPDQRRSAGPTSPRRS